MILKKYKKIWLVDFEFLTPAGGIPEVHCMVARDYLSGETIRLWADQLQLLSHAPFSTDIDSLYVSYYAPAEMLCHISLGWPMPVHILDLFAEYRNLRNGISLPDQYDLVSALNHFGISHDHECDKEQMRKLAMREGPYTAEEKTQLIDYCESDVIALEKLLSNMEIHIDIPLALHRGNYMKAVAYMESIGIPIDMQELNRIKSNWDHTIDQLIREVDKHYGVYEGRTFKRYKFKHWLNKHNIKWPKLSSGELDLSRDRFKEMAKIHQEINLLKELRSTISSFKEIKLTIGKDGRNRTSLSAFRSKTGRNQPSTNRFIFGPSVWLRGLIRPMPGYGIAYIDWDQQEFGIAAALSEDPLMQTAYNSGDPYISFAKQARVVPADATKESHIHEREKFKACVLAVQYGMGAESLARNINDTTSKAQELLYLHRNTYKQFWKWSDACVDYASINGKLETVFGWTLHTTNDFNERSIRNFPMQANGAEMLRLACYMAMEEGIRVCAPIHDAILVEAKLEELDATVKKTQEIMASASEIILGGFKLSTDACIVIYPDRYMDKRGEEMWNKIQTITSSTCLKTPHLPVAK